MLKFNYHSHSTFCDGKSTLEQMVQEAINKGLTYFGFSAHAPFPQENKFALPYEHVQEYLDTAKMLKEKYRNQINLFTAMEFDYIPTLCTNIRERAKEYNLDYIIACVHMVYSPNGLWFIDGHDQSKYDDGLNQYFGGDIYKGVRAFYNQTNEMLQSTNPDIIGHFDKIRMHNRGRYFQTDEKWYTDLIMETLQLIKEKGTICEVNTRGLYKGRSDDYFPETRWIKKAVAMNIPLTISTDCHNVNEVGALFVECREHLKECGAKEIYYFDGQWKTDKI
jgi:histidinol phosphate phosphatase HisJ family